MYKQPILHDLLSYSSLVDILRERTSKKPDQTLYTFLSDGEFEDSSLTYAALDRRARAIAVQLQESIRQPGERVLLLYPPGLEYVSAFFGCLYAGMVAVPSYPPRLNRPDQRLQMIVQDSQARVVLTTPQILASIEQRLANTPDLAAMRWLTTQDIDISIAEQWKQPQLDSNSLAFLQYTSGSTSHPKGVMVSHGNLIHNAQFMQDYFGHSAKSRYVSWLPLYHDMGLIGCLLQSFYVDFPAVLMPPTAFIESPIRWLRAISRYKGTTSGAPNFAFDLCVDKITEEQKQGLDLSSWELAYSGAEPIRKETLERFAETFAPYGLRAETLHASYGLAEATLMVSGGTKGIWPRIHSFNADYLTQNIAVLADANDQNPRNLVSVGTSSPDQKLLIVDPETFLPCPDHQVGEIWLDGPSVAHGYWNRPDETAKTFQAHLAGSGAGPFLRTGDLGFIYDGELFIAARAKDLIIIRGRNYYPQDIELTVDGSHADVAPGSGAAFSVEVQGEERLVIVQEVDRHAKAEEFPNIISAIRSAVVEQHELQAYAVVLIRIRSIPRTSSFKLQRRACRTQYLDGSLMVLANSTLEPDQISDQAENQFENIAEDLSLISDPVARQTLLTSYLQQQAANILGMSTATILPEQALTSFGLDSMMAVELKYAIETTLQTSCSIVDFLQGISVSQLAAHILAAKPGGQNSITPAAEYPSDTPLSHGQQALWFINQLAPDSPAYNIHSLTRICQQVDVFALQRAFQKLVERHPALRTTFQAQGDKPIQRIAPQLVFTLKTKDISAWDDPTVNQYLLKETRRPFDLERGPLMRVRLLSRSEDEHILLFVMHHIIVDFWSISIFLDELGQLYAAEKSGTALKLPPLTLQYSDYVRWQTETLAGAEGERLLKYWQKKLSGNLPVLDLPTDHPRPPSQTWNGGSQTLKLGATLSRKIKELGQQSGATLYMTLLAAFQVLLHRYTDQVDILVGSPTAGRSHAELAPLVGYFVNPIVLRADFSGSPSFNAFLLQVRQTALEAFAHQDYPFDLLVEHLHPHRDPSRSPIFQAMFVLQKAPQLESQGLAALALGQVGAKLDLHGLILDAMLLDQLSAQFDLTLAAADTVDGLSFSIEYNHDLFNTTTIQRMLVQFEVLLESIVTKPDASVKSLRILGMEERHKLLVDWNATEAEYVREQCIHQLFEAQVEKTPEAIAVVFEGQQLTYAELNAKANQLAHYLRSQGVGPDVMVGICVERSLEMIVGLLGILKAGGAYVPLDPAYPKDRLTYMLEDSSPAILLTQQHLQEMLPIAGFCLDSQWQTISNQPSTNPENITHPDNLAYTIYTSGSTGLPKGTLLSHVGLNNLVMAQIDTFEITPESRLLQVVSLNFDVATGDIYTALLGGATLCLASQSDALSPDDLANRLSSLEITVVQIPVALLAILPEVPLPHLKTLIVGGEACPTYLIARWGKGRNFYNAYGPTETTICSTTMLCVDPLSAPPIGRPLANIQIYLLDNSLNPVSVGVAGELCIAGIGLARGYLNHPALTADKFVPNPFIAIPGARMYKSGDLARYLPDGKIEYLGRIDSQVKIRGLRIELGEIEAALDALPEVREAIVVAIDMAQMGLDRAEEKRLVAYLVPQSGQSLPETSVLRIKLAQSLPEYMIPTYFVSLKELPLTLNGKIDRKALPAPDMTRSESGYVAPRTSTEERLAEIWTDVLKLNKVGILDNFFELGGHSLLATQVISKVRTVFQIDIPLRMLFAFPQIEMFGIEIDQEIRNNPTSAKSQHLIPRRRDDGAIPLSFAQQRLWFLDQFEPGSAFYNIPAALRLIGKLNEDALRHTLNEIVRRHDILRTNFSTLDGTPTQVIVEELILVLPVTDLTKHPIAERETYALQLAQNEALTPFDLSTGPIIRASLLRLDATDNILLFTMHHIASDGWSMGVLINEIAVLYSAYIQNRSFAIHDESPLQELSIQYADFAHWQRQWLSGDVLQQQLDYWAKQLNNSPTLLTLPTDRPRPVVQSHHGAVKEFEISAQTTDALYALTRQTHTTLFMALTAVFNILLSRYSGQSDICIGTPIANRNRAEVEVLIGFFVNTLVLRTQINTTDSFESLLEQVRTTTLDAYTYQDVPFEQLVELLKPERHTSHSPLFQVMLALQNIPIQNLELPDLKLQMLSAEHTTAKFDLTLNIVETDGQLFAAFEYNIDLFDEATIQRMATHFTHLLDAIVVNPAACIRDLQMLTAPEMNQILVEWNATETAYPQGECIHQRFESQVQKTPEALAVIFKNQQLTYAELNAKANQLAHHLRTQGVGPDVLVGICVERSIEMIVGLLGILKAGGAYLPLDPSYPQERLTYMLEDALPAALLTQQHLQHLLPVAGFCLDSDWETLKNYPATNPLNMTVSANLAYIIYTSGSTGKPKGVLLHHDGLSNLAYAQADMFSIQPSQRVLQFASFNFDASTWEIFMALSWGATLCMAARDDLMPGEKLDNTLQQLAINVVTLPPVALNMSSARLPMLETIVVAGEACPASLVSQWADNHQFFNAYGPTEATVCATIQRCHAKQAGSPPIGRPIANGQIYLLDEAMNPVPIGAPGELYIAGISLARGYINRPDLTADKFIPNPFSPVPGARMYKSGDLARYLADGTIEYLNRIDSQVKIRGFRIELDEIEAALTALPEVQDAIVIAREDTVDDSSLPGTGKRLVAYLIAQTGCDLPETAMLRSKLAQSLPDYMVPSYFIQIAQFPLTPNGKIDHKALPAPDMTQSQATYVAPRSDIEKIISQIWMEVLQLEKVGINDNFFDLGGHSLLIARVHSRLREQLQRDIKMVTLFQYPTVHALAAHLSPAETDKTAFSTSLLRAQLRRDLMKQPEDAIAVIALTGRFPGAPDTDVLWQNLSAGKEAITPFTDEELRAAGVDEALLNNPNYVKAGSVLENTDAFDPYFFGYNPREAAFMDPQQRIFLENAWQALERAGYDSERYAGRIAVYASISFNSYLQNNLMQSPESLESMGLYQTMLGNDKDFLATRVSYKLNLKGPSLNVQTACSSSLVAIHLACQSLLRGETDMALAGGVSIIQHQKAGYLYEEGGIASPDGHCRAFDAQSKGTVGGNGVGIVVLKRLSQALADGDTICAVIKGTAINNDGSLKVGYTAPSVDGQAEVIAEAQSMAGIEPETISYVEAHGTGTVLGDPIEITALTKAFTRRGQAPQPGTCAIGSVKSNLGHLDAAAGVTGLIKTVLSLQHKAIPPSLHFKQPNPTIDFENSPFYVNTALKHWTVGVTARRAGVSAFGMGGTNAHVVLEEAPKMVPSSASRSWQLLLLSAKTETALEKATTDLVAHLKAHPEQNLADTAYTLQVGRRIFNHRRAVICKNVEDASATLETLDPKQTFTAFHEQKEQPVAFMFTGQGAQYVNMGRKLYRLEPVFREAVDRCCQILLPRLGLDLRSVLYPVDPEEAAQQLSQTWLTQPALFVIEYALAQLWMSWGIQPKALIGHSIGEYVAACISGVFSLEGALLLVAARGRLMQSLPGGAMLAVPLTELEVQTLLGDQLSLAAVNGPALCIVSGTNEAVAALEDQLKERCVECRRLHTSHAFHSSMMDPILDAFKAEVQRIKLNVPQIPFISNLTGAWITPSEAINPEYWVRHLRSTVRFADGLGQLLKDPAALLLLEVGPGRTLTNLALNHPAKVVSQTILPSLRPAQDTQSDTAFLLTTVGKLWLAGVTIDWAAFHQGEHRYRIPLPTYPFERQRCWIEPSKATTQPDTEHIYKKKDIADWLYTPSWQAKPLPTQKPVQQLKNCLIFIDQNGFGLTLANRLKQQGIDVVTVQSHAGWQCVEDDQYILDPTCPDHYAQLFIELMKIQKTPDVIIHLWSLTQTTNSALDPAYFAQIQSLGFNSLVYLTQALNSHNMLKPVQLEVLSNGIYPFEGPIQPEKATILGPCRVIPQEMPSITCRYTDIILPTQESREETRLVNQIASQVLDEPSNDTFAYRNGQRWGQNFQPLALQSETNGLLRKNGVYLITGGLGNLGLMLAEHLAKQISPKLVLTGRSAFLPRENWAAHLAAQEDELSRKIRQIQAIEALGAEVLVLTVDVTNTQAMQDVISEIDRRWDGLHGVFHLAGLVHDMSPVQELTAQQYEAHLRPKVYGVLALEQVLQGRELDFCVLFSSLASVLGGLGFSAYAAANNFMDAAARKQNQQGSTPWISVNWDGWQTATQLSAKIAGSTLKDLAITAEEGMDVLQRILSSESLESEVIVSTASLQARINKWIKVKSLKEQMREKQSGEIVLQARPTLSSNYVAPQTQTEQMLVSIWQDILGIEKIGIHDNFFDLGGHSLLATQVISKIRVACQITIPLRILFEAPSIAILAIEVDKEIQDLEEIEV